MDSSQTIPTSGQFSFKNGNSLLTLLKDGLPTLVEVIHILKTNSQPILDISDLANRISHFRSESLNEQDRILYEKSKIQVQNLSLKQFTKASSSVMEIVSNACDAQSAAIDERKWTPRKR